MKFALGHLLIRYVVLILSNYLANRPYPVIWKTVPIRINILKLHQVNFCIDNITLSKFQGDTRNSSPDIAFRIYINFYEKLAICTWVGTKYCILPILSQRVLFFKNIVIIIRFNFSPFLV